MNFLNRFDVGFFNTVQYDSDLKDDSWFSKFENAADVCRAPARWFATEAWGGGKTYTVNVIDDKGEFACEEVESKAAQGAQKAIRIGLGVLLGIVGQVLALALMGVAFISEEIRLKHKISVRTLSDDEQQKLNDFVNKRQELAKERQGCEPVSCLLCSICCLLCCLVLK